MAGLLDDLLGNLNSDQGLLGLAMLSAAAPRERRTTLGEGLMSGLSLVNQRKLQREEQAMRQAEMRMREQDFGLRQKQAGLQEQQILQAIAAQKQQQEEAARQKEQERALRDMMLRDLSPVSGIDANAQSGVTGPRPEALSVVGQKRPIDWQKYIALGVPPERIKAMAEAPNLGRAEVARTIEVMGQNGPETVQFDKFGNRVGAGLQKPVELGMQDLGGAVAPWNKYTGAFVGPQTGKTMTPGEKASNALGWANNAVSRDRLAFDKGQADKPVWDTERGIVIDPRSGAARDVVLGGKPVGPKDKGLNDTQAKALLFGSRMQEADKVINELAANGVSTPSLIKQGAEALPLVGGGLGTIANMTVASSAQQQVEQAQRDFINATLRRESGAAIAPTEFENARKQYFPQPGDSKEVLEQKARNRALATRMMLAEVPDGKRPATSQPGKVINFGDLN